MKNMKPKDNQQLLLIKYFRGIYLMMQFAQIKQSVYCVKPYEVIVFSTILQYSSILVGSDPSALSIRVILQSSKKWS